MESEFFVKSFLLSLSGFVQVKNSPLLMVSSVVVLDTDCISFSVTLVLDFEDLLVLPIDELFVLILEYLPPVRIGAPDLHVL
jgi:hypothetical protein